jgi:hypothetical protein
MNFWKGAAFVGSAILFGLALAQGISIVKDFKNAGREVQTDKREVKQQARLPIYLSGNWNGIDQRLLVTFNVKDPAKLDNSQYDVVVDYTYKKDDKLLIQEVYRFSDENKIVILVASVSQDGPNAEGDVRNKYQAWAGDKVRVTKSGPFGPSTSVSWGIEKTGDNVSVWGRKLSPQQAEAIGAHLAKVEAIVKDEKAIGSAYQEAFTEKRPIFLTLKEALSLK